MRPKPKKSGAGICNPEQRRPAVTKALPGRTRKCGIPANERSLNRRVRNMNDSKGINLKKRFPVEPVFGFFLLYELF